MRTGTRSRLKALVSLLALVVGSGACPAASSTSVAVEVVGEGTSSYAAQASAIRQALQQVVRQVVVAERRIENDEVLIDQVLSSANGYIEAFQVLSEEHRDGLVLLRVRVVVSTAPIENFVVGGVGDGSQLPGSALFADIVREELDREFRSGFIERLFLGYPHRAIDVRVRSATADPSQRGAAIVTVQYSLRDEFVAALKSGLSAVACESPRSQSTCKPDAAKICFNKEVNLGTVVTDILKDVLQPGRADKGYECYGVPAGKDRQTRFAKGGFRIFEALEKELHLVALFLDGTGQRVRGESQPCLDARFKLLEVPIDARYRIERVSWSATDGALIVRTQPMTANLQFDVGRDPDRFARTSAVQFIPVIRTTRNGSANPSDSVEILSTLTTTQNSMAPAPSMPAQWRVDNCYR